MRSPPLWTDGTGASPEVSAEEFSENIWLDTVIHEIAPARRAEDPGLNSGPGENVSLKFTKYDLTRC